jgi:hypothetical protein
MKGNKYKTGKIYTIRSKNDDNVIYAGSAVQQLHKRWYEHKQTANNEKGKGYNRFLYPKIRETDFNDWYSELYEDFPAERPFPAERKEQLNTREGENFREIGPLNKNTSGRTNEEYRQ